MPLYIQPSFAKGEIASSLWGRVDTAAYQIALRTARNAIIHPYGGVSNRPGLSFIGPCKDHSYAPRLIDFEFKTTDAYILEFGNLYMRVIRNDEYVTNADITITGITAASPAVVTSVAHGLSSSDEAFVDGIVGTMSRLNGRRFNITVLSADTFSLQDQVTNANIDTTGLVYTSGGIAASIYEVVTTYVTADLGELKWVQSADVATITHRSYPVQELSRHDHDDWTFAEPTFAPSQAYPTGIGLSVGGSDNSKTYRYQVTAIAKEGGEESLPAIDGTAITISAITKASPGVVTATSHGLSEADEVEINAVVGMTQVNGLRYKARNVTTDTFELDEEDTTGFDAYVSGGTANRTFVRTTAGSTTIDDTVSWTAAAGAGKYSIYFEDNGIFGFIGDSETTSFHNANIEADLDTTPPQARNPFRGTGNYPGTASYFEQRRVMGGSTDHPDTSHYSQTGNQSNFSASSPQQDDDAFSATLNALKVNEIRHYVPGNDLLVLTSGGEWRNNSGQDNAFAAATIKQKPQSYWGASHDKPIISGNTTLFVEENRSRVRSLGYSLQIDGYTGTDLTLLANHIFFTYSVSDWAFARAPDGVAHVVRSDGKAAAMTFQQEQEVIAWTRWDTRGKFERVASIRHADGERDDRVYFVVKRRINGHDVRYIERLHSRRFTDVRDCVFMDSAVSYDDPVTITNVTSASPAVVTAAAHGFSDGDEIDIFDIEWEPDFDEFDGEVQPDQLNTHRYKVYSSTTDTFQLKTLSDDTVVSGAAFNNYQDGGTARKAVITITGLDHIEGCEVVILADGNVIKGKTVANGSITLNRRFSRIHIGLAFTTDIETLNIEAPSATIQGELKKISEVVLKMEKSRGLWIGPSFDNLTEFKQRKFENMGDPTQLLTGDTDPIPVNSNWDANGRLAIRQRDPLPLTILAILPQVTLGGHSRDE